MHRLSAWTFLVLVMTAPGSMVACADEGGDAAGGAGGAGGSSGSGGPSGGSDPGGDGGSSEPGGDAGVGNDAGAGASLGGSGNGNGGNGAAGGAGDSPGIDCDISGMNKPIVVLPNEITSDMTLDSSNDYSLSGLVSVGSGATLTIPACTRLEGSPIPTPGVLLVQRGGRLEAIGTPNEPILFTSREFPGTREAGEWGGVILLGRAPITRPAAARENIHEGMMGEAYTYGATNPDPNDDSGTLRYVRIEFGGAAILPGVEVNGLSMAGVGSGTTIDHVMVSNTLDDCFEWWGGTVRADYLVANNCGDDYFNGGEGWHGGGEYWFGRRANFAISSANPNGLELASISDNSSPRTNFSVANLTLCGTGQDSLTIGGSYGMVLRELVSGSIDSIALSGFDFALDPRDGFQAGDVTIRNSTFWDLIFQLDNNANEAGLGDNDAGFIDGSIFTEEASNRLDPGTKPFSIGDCVEAAGPTEEVLSSGVGAFADGADWLRGAWVNWLEE